MSKSLAFLALVSFLLVILGFPPLRAQQAIFEIFIDPTVASDLGTKIRETIPAALGYYNTTLGRTRTRPARAFFLPNLEAMARKWSEVYQVSLEEAQSRIGNRQAVAARGQDIWMHLDDAGLRRERGRLEKIVAHEVFHLVQTEMGDPGGRGQWLNEGAAEFLGYRVADTMKVLAWETARGQLLSRVFSTIASAPGILQASETPTGFNTLNQTWRGAMYPYTALAVEFLVGNNPVTLRRYHEGLGEGREWQESFRLAFGQTTSEFYGRWEAHLQTQRR